MIRSNLNLIFVVQINIIILNIVICFHNFHNYLDRIRRKRYKRDMRNYNPLQEQSIGESIGLLHTYFLFVYLSLSYLLEFLA